MPWCSTPPPETNLDMTAFSKCLKDKKITEAIKKRHCRCWQPRYQRNAQPRHRDNGQR
jgi:hypothetical protein